jgi:porin
MKSPRIANSRWAIHSLAHLFRNAFLPALLFSLFLSGSASSFAGAVITSSAPADKELTAAEKLKNPYFLTGDWGGLRPLLEQHGVTFDLFETYDTYGNVSGGDHRAEEYFGRTLLTMDVDLEKLVGWTGAEFYVTAVTQQGPNYSQNRIDVYTIPSGIEGKQTTRLAEIWLQQKFFGDKVALKVGKIDGSGEFGGQELASSFMNDELNYTPNLTFTAGMPFDPAGKPGAVLTLKPLDGPILSGFYIKGGIFAGNDNNAYLHDDTGTSFAVRAPTIMAAEVGWRTPEKSNLLPGVYKVGMHYSMGDTSRFDGTVASNNYIIYGNFSQTLHYLDTERTRHVDAGLTLGGAPGDRNKNYLEATAILRVVGPWAARPKDETGVGFIVSNFSHDFSEQSVDTGGPDLSGSEKVFEISYKAQINRWFVLQPDMQFIFDPQGNSSRRTVVLLGMRTFVTF